MIFDIMTLFPELVQRVLSESIIGRATKNGIIDIKCHNIRDFSEDKHRRVDDTPYGGGKGMLMAAPPIYNCYKHIIDSHPETEGKRCVIYMSPAGTVLNQKKAESLSEFEHIIILCGHYEGVDRRIIDEIVDMEISIGDFVLTGGEIPACILVDCVSRLADGVLAAPECYEEESISSGLLEYPQYTRPYEFHGVSVPDVLISGHHENIDKWRLEKAIELTKERRPDLYSEYERSVSDEKKKSKK